MVEIFTAALYEHRLKIFHVTLLDITCNLFMFCYIIANMHDILEIHLLQCAHRYATYPE